MERKRRSDARVDREPKRKRSRTSSQKTYPQNRRSLKDQTEASRSNRYSSRKHSTHRDKKSLQSFSAEYQVTDSIGVTDPSPEQQHAVLDVAKTCKDISAKCILPTRDEIDAGDNYCLKPNPIDQPYSSVDEYVSIHFNLLKEDYLRPLRRAISYARDVLSRAVKKDKRSTDVRIYPNVKISQSFYGRERGILFQIQLTRLNLDRKSFMQNALVLLSKDKFRTFYFGTVKMRIESGYQRNAILTIGLKPIKPDALEFFRDLCASGQQFDMLETTAFFYMTSQALEVLQAIASEHVEGKLFPLCEHIVQGKSTDVVPRYVQQLNNSYRGLDISCIIGDGNPRKAFWQNTCDGCWPETSELLNEMQYKAYRHAFSHPVALIQGPPGTGKTFIGVLVVSSILRTLQSVTKAIQSHRIHHRPNNIVVMPCKPCSDVDIHRKGENTKCVFPPTSSDTDTNAETENVALPSYFDLHYENAESLVRDFGPILVVCFKNHALDQFLSSIIRQDPDILKPTKESPGIIRVGGGCKDPFLNQFLLHNCSFKYAPEGDTTNIQVKRLGLFGTEERIKKIDAQILHLCDNIASQKSLRVAMGENNFQQLASENTTYGDGLLKWLFYDFPDDQELERRRIVNEASCQTENCIASRITSTPRVYDMTLSDTPETPALYLKVPRVLSAHKVQHLLRDDEIEHFRRVAEGGQTNRRQFSTIDVEKPCEKYPNIWDIPHRVKWDIYYGWADQCKHLLKTQKEQLEETYITLGKELKLLLQEQDYNVLKKAKIIAMTTTAAAKNRTLLQRVAPRVVVIEEAAEVLESHTISALSEHTEHVIMIGDHQQLRPASHDYELGKSHKLTCSMFERLVNVKLPFEALNVQHRMRPELSALIVPEVYPSLVDHETVTGRPNVRGMQKNVFFMDHCQHEAESSDSTSHANEFEAQLLCCLAGYLVMQGYQQSEITILVTYETQRELIRKRVRLLMSLFTKTAPLHNTTDGNDRHEIYPDEDFETTDQDRIKVTTVDNYQGEENKIVLLSLVRSNTFSDIGYVKDKLRICVMLSRARDGLYVVGNLQQMKESSGLWRSILNKATALGIVGKHIPIQCPNHKHPQYKSRIYDWPEIATKAPEGGCRQPCGVTKKCGHMCDRLCHGNDADHNLPCYLPCNKRCQNNHSCMLKCFEPCNPCIQIVNVKARGCNHNRAIECHLSNIPLLCTASIFITLRCGHTSWKQCGAVELPVCLERCNKLRFCGHRCLRVCTECSGNCEELPCGVFGEKKLLCGHTIQKACSAEIQSCTAYCDAELQCGHKCKNVCGFCFSGRIHGECKEMCTKILICGHEQIISQCDNPCKPCNLSCTRQCQHSWCEKQCGEICNTCSKKCKLKLKHTGSRCSKPCFEPCRKLKRSKTCRRKFSCGHKCRGIKGLSCPGKCRRCDPSTAADHRNIKLECGHTFDTLNLDRQLSEGNSSSRIAIQFLKCPECQTIITHSRYQNADVTKQARKDLETVKQKLLEFEQRDVEEDKTRFLKLVESNPHIRDKLLRSTNIREIIKATNAARLANGLNMLLKNVTFRETLLQKDNFEKLQREINRMIQLVEKWQVASSHLNDILLELRRLGVWYNAEMLHGGDISEDQSQKLSEHLKRLRGCNRMTLEDLEDLKNFCCDLGATSTSFTVSWEHEVALEGIPDTQHISWLKCSKGHIYYEGVLSRTAGKIGCSKCGDKP